MPVNYSHLSTLPVHPSTLPVLSSVVNLFLLFLFSLFHPFFIFPFHFFRVFFSTFDITFTAHSTLISLHILHSLQIRHFFHCTFLSLLSYLFMFLPYPLFLIFRLPYFNLYNYFPLSFFFHSAFFSLFFYFIAFYFHFSLLPHYHNLFSFTLFLPFTSFFRSLFSLLIGCKGLFLSSLTSLIFLRHVNLSFSSLFP